MKVKVCPKCKITKPWTDYYLRQTSKLQSSKYPVAYCKSCNKIKQKEKYQQLKNDPIKYKLFLNKNNRSAAKHKIRKQIKKEYGQSIDWYNKRLVYQNSLCGICNMDIKQNKRALSVDHNHKTNQLRGLLCHNCNVGLGHFKDNFELLEKAIKYLNQWESVFNKEFIKE